MVGKIDPALAKKALAVLKGNDRGNYIQPAADLYPHQWLWDSCFIAIGLRHLDVDRAQTELKSLLRGQWRNGMLPNMIFRDEAQYRTSRDSWRSWLNPAAPTGVATSGITQPPMLAEAVVQVGAKLGSDRHRWYKLMYPALVAYHEWLYAERDPHQEGLVLQIHPWETGSDNSPPWMSELHEHLMPAWIRGMEKLKLDSLIKFFRTDTKTIPLEQRTAIYDSLAMYETQRRLKRKSYDINKILDHSLFTIEDLGFNCLLIKANSNLEEIAKTLKEELPEPLKKQILLARKKLNDLWDPPSGQYYSRDFITHRLIKTASVATLLPLYAGCISQTRAEELVKLLEDEHQFKLTYPVPSVPLSSAWFNPKRYWQGPTWLNINWLIIKGLEAYGFKAQAKALRDSSLELVSRSGCYEYFNPITGEGLGAANFSWTAALAIDLINDAP